MREQTRPKLIHNVFVSKRIRKAYAADTSQFLLRACLRFAASDDGGPAHVFINSCRSNCCFSRSVFRPATTAFERRFHLPQQGPWRIVSAHRSRLDPNEGPQTDRAWAMVKEFIARQLKA